MAMASSLNTLGEEERFDGSGSPQEGPDADSKNVEDDYDYDDEEEEEEEEEKEDPDPDYGEKDPVVKAIYVDDPHALFEALGKDANGQPNVSKKLSGGYRRMSALAVACALVKIKCAEALVANGADMLTGMDTFIGTPLHSAAKAGSLPIAKCLIGRAMNDGTLCEMIHAENSCGFKPYFMCETTHTPESRAVYQLLVEAHRNFPRKYSSVGTI